MKELDAKINSFKIIIFLYIPTYYKIIMKKYSFDLNCEEKKCLK